MKVFIASMAVAALASTTSAMPTSTQPPAAKRTVAPGYEYCESFETNEYHGLEYGIELGVAFQDGEGCNFIHDSLVDTGVTIADGTWVCEAPFGNQAETYLEFKVDSTDGSFATYVNEVMWAIYGRLLTDGIYCVNPYDYKRDAGEAELVPSRGKYVLQYFG